MQMLALPGRAMRIILLCFLERAFLATGFLSRSFLSRAIPQLERVTTVYNLDHDLGVVRPTLPPVAPAPAPAAATAAATAAQDSSGNVTDVSSVNASSLTVTVSTTLSSPVAAGATSLPLVVQAGFEVGKTVVIAQGTSKEEVNAISGFGSIILQNPLKYSHDAGVTIGMAAQASASSSSASSSSSAAASSIVATPVTPATSASMAASTAAAAAGVPKPPPAVPQAPGWKIQAVFEMVTQNPLFTSEYESSVPGLALTLAERLKLATDVPLSRFAFWFPNPGGIEADKTLFCQSKWQAKKARWAVASNTSYTCILQQHRLNVSQTNGTIGTGSLLQTGVQRGGRERAQTSKKKVPLAFEVAIYPPTGLLGDGKPAQEVATDVVTFCVGSDEPERKLLETGIWTYKDGPGVKFHGFFPGAVAVMPGMVPQPRDTSLPLGPNPGGHGAEMTTTLKPMPGKKQALETEMKNMAVEAVIYEAKEVNGAVSTSLKELHDSLARASAAHARVMNTNPYQLPEDIA